MRSGPTVRRVLRTHFYATNLLSAVDGVFHWVRRLGEPGPEQRRIFDALGVDWRNLPKFDLVAPEKACTFGDFVMPCEIRALPVKNLRYKVRAIR